MSVKVIAFLTCPVDDVEEHLGVILQPHGEVVELLGLPDERAPHVDPLVDGHARLLLRVGLVCIIRGRRKAGVSQSTIICAIAVNQRVIEFFVMGK